MQSFDDDPDFGGSQDGSSDDEQNDPADDVEEEGDAEDDQEAEDDDEGEGESEDERTQDNNSMSNSQTSQQDSRMNPKGPSSIFKTEPGSVPTSLGDTPVLAPTSHPRPTVTLTSPSPQPGAVNVGREADPLAVRPEALTATVYDIVPTIAAPQSTSINVVTATPDLRWVFTGGSDGYIRKFNWVDTVNSKLMLTVAQRHPFVDSVTKAGVLSSYWENEEPPAQGKTSDDTQALSPVYSLAVHKHALWLLSGLESGGINLQSVRHEEGKRITCLQKHSSAVSVLNLAQDENSVLSGAWDKAIYEWDLNTGLVKRSFDGSGGQITAIEMRPYSSLPVPEASGEILPTNGTMSSNNADKPKPNGVLPNGTTQDSSETAQGENGTAGAGFSPGADSLFGGNDNDSLFGDNDDDNAGAGQANFGGDDYDDEFSRAIANGIQQQEDAEGDVNMISAGVADDDPFMNSLRGPGESGDIMNMDIKTEAPSADDPAAPLTNGLPHAEDVEMTNSKTEETEGTQDRTFVADTTFLSASFDGALRVWDKRRAKAIAKISPRDSPPWCMGACWSPDGNFIYAGRRNGTVEEYSLHKGLKGVERTFRFPNGSGPVSAVRAMPNGRHLICASFDILRLYDLQHSQTSKHSSVPFLIVPGHRTGVVSQLYLDPTCRFMISTAGNRGWEGNSTQVLLGYEINI